VSWRPLLEGDLAARASDAVRAISEELPEPAYPSVGGKAGVALFYGYLGDAERADELMDRTIDGLAAIPMRPAWHGGFTGIAWSAEHLGRLLGEESDDDMNEEIDESLLTALAGPWTGDYDLITGLAGFGVYALDRTPRPSAVRCVEAIVDRLDETAESRDGGITWFTPPELLFRHQRDQLPRGGYNAGVAHGVPGVIAFLANVCRLGIRPERARPLLEGAVSWVLSHGPSFPAWVVPGTKAHPTRLAWCYGSPGISATLLIAARAIGNEEWERTAWEIALRAAATAPEDSGVQDAGLCHGALGLAHVYNRLYQAGGGEPFADAARLWYGRGLDFRRAGRGIAGFESWELDPDMQMRWRTEPGFLTGAAGIGLALLAGLTPVEPQWDRLLAISPSGGTPA
jgi:lantibiotic modifying enzyme